MIRPSDHDDEAILRRIRALYQAADPVPPELLVRVRFAMDLDQIDREFAQVCEDLQVSSAVRGPEHARTITFECDSLTVAITVTPTAADRIRLDGWLVPPAALRVELRTGNQQLHTMADEGGRFAFDDLPHGEVQLAVLPAPGTPVDLDHAVVAQTIVL
ncbi:MAG TPA: hypothetical protein VGJ95_21890 [Pseudonocardiaceae bacterium]|jgi:hypothetical protein